MSSIFKITILRHSTRNYQVNSSNVPQGHSQGGGGLRHPLGSGGGPRKVLKFEMSTPPPFGAVQATPMWTLGYVRFVNETLQLAILQQYCMHTVTWGCSES